MVLTGVTGYSVSCDPRPSALVFTSIAEVVFPSRTRLCSRNRRPHLVPNQVTESDRSQDTV